MQDHKKYVIHIRNLKQALNHGLALKKVESHEVQLKSLVKTIHWYRQRAKKKNPKRDFKKEFFKSMNNAVFTKTMESVMKHRDIKLVRNEARRNCLVSEPSYHTTKNVSNNLLAK